MKYIHFKKVPMIVEIDGQNVPTVLDYKAELLKLCTGPKDPNGGTDYDEMELVLPIRVKIKAVMNNELELEDAEHGEIVLRVKAGKFNFNKTELFEMLKHFKEGYTPDGKAVKAVS